MSYVIAIDGYSACGKSTLARALAERLNYRFVDTGAMYRMVTLHFLRAGVDINDAAAVEEALNGLSVDFAPGTNRALLNGEDVEGEIRGMAVSNFVSPVAAVPAVRRAIVPLQRRIGERGAVVMDGRDIGTVVFPNADLKLFVTAALDTRVDRRLAEMRAAGKNPLRQEVTANLLERDHIDSTRADSPLRQAEDAVVLDNTELEMEEFIAAGLAEVEKLRC